MFVEVTREGLDVDLIPFQYDPVQLTPRNFEIEVRRFLVGLGTNLSNFQALHDQVITKPDGDYQIDVYVTFEALGADFKVLIECKHHKRPVERQLVQVLHDRLASVGAHKGMIFSTGGFQSGALRYAKEHGIACVHVMDGKAVYGQKSIGNPVQLPPWAEPVTSRLVWIEEREDGGWALPYAASTTDSAREMLGLSEPSDTK